MLTANRCIAAGAILILCTVSTQAAGQQRLDRLLAGIDTRNCTELEKAKNRFDTLVMLVGRRSAEERTSRPTRAIMPNGRYIEDCPSAAPADIERRLAEQQAQKEKIDLLNRVLNDLVNQLEGRTGDTDEKDRDPTPDGMYTRPHSI